MRRDSLRCVALYALAHGYVGGVQGADIPFFYLLLLLSHGCPLGWARVLVRFRDELLRHLSRGMEGIWLLARLAGWMDGWNAVGWLAGDAAKGIGMAAIAVLSLALGANGRK